MPASALAAPPKPTQAQIDAAKKIEAEKKAAADAAAKKLTSAKKTLRQLTAIATTKRKAYIYQDKHHKIYDPRYSITTDRIVELLAASQLLCFYCREICQVTYKEAMCRRQWTLDRIDNNYGHNDANVVIACLDCNLKRGTMDAERFRQGKQFTFRKIE